MKNLSLFIHFGVFVLSGNLYSQTKLISYKSHSGDMKYFEKSIVENSHTTNYSNLGVAPERYVINSKLDSVIIIDEHKSVIVTSTFCKTRRNENPERWKPGRDTVYHHSVFSSQNIDSVKNVLRRNYHFQNDIDSTVFLKYDKKTKQYQPISSKKAIKKAEIKGLNSQEEMLSYFILSAAVLAFVFVYRRSH